jgi:hypothetical protein
LNGGLFGGFNAITATGGTISDYTDSTDGFQYRSHTFDASGTFTITANPEGLTFDVLVVGAGGGRTAIYNRKSAGGGGEALKTLGEAGNVEAYTVTIPAGTQNEGDDAIFVSAPGTTAALTGRGGIEGQVDAGDSGNGNAGGDLGAAGGGGGGGGSGGAGTTPATVAPYWGQTGGNGGIGSTNTEFQAGSSTFGGGGGGGSANGTVYSVYGYGGSGGGGNGGAMGWYNSGIPCNTNGGVNTGGGAGGAGDSGGPGCTPAHKYGGSGKVIIRYALEDVS